MLKKLYLEKIKLLEYKEKELKMYDMTINKLKKEVEILQETNDVNYSKVNEKEMELFEKELSLKERERNLRQLEERLSKIDNIQMIRESNVVNKENKLLDLQLSININSVNEDKINKNGFTENDNSDELVIESYQPTKKN